MTTSARRITAGLLVALTVGTFGPIQRAVSHESKTYIEITQPLFEDGRDYPWLSLWAQSTRGAGATWEIPGQAGTTRITLMAVVGDTATSETSDRATSAHAWNGRHAALSISTCPYQTSYSCTGQTWTGANTFEHDAAFTTATFVGTLVDADGAPCEVDATWEIRDGHNVVYPRAPNEVSNRVRTRAPASLTLESSCIGTHRVDGVDQAEMWTDTVVL